MPHKPRNENQPEQIAQVGNDPGGRDSLAKAFARMVMRRVITFKERKRHKALSAALSDVAKTAANSRKHEFEANSVVFNIGLFFLLAERDIQAMKIDALTHPDPWKRSLCSRVILLTLHELDLDKVAGNKLRAAMADAGVPQEIQDRVTKALRAARNAQEQARKQFAFLRNATIAHRDPNALMQHQAILEIDEMKVLQIATEFYTGAQLFINVMSDLMMYTGRTPGLVRQTIAKAKCKAVDSE